MSNQKFRYIVANYDVIIRWLKKCISMTKFVVIKILEINEIMLLYSNNPEYLTFFNCFLIPISFIYHNYYFLKKPDSFTSLGTTFLTKF